MITNKKYMSTDLKEKNGVPTTQDVLTHHLNSFGDIAGTMADYTAESRFFTPDGRQGKVRSRIPSARSRLTPARALGNESRGNDRRRICRL